MYIVGNRNLQTVSGDVAHVLNNLKLFWCSHCKSRLILNTNLNCWEKHYIDLIPGKKKLYTKED